MPAQQNRGSSNPIYPGCELKYELPKAILSVRDGWQWTSQSGAVVSGLLASVAAQLLSFFKTDENFKRYEAEQGTKDFIVATCYLALFLNIGATIWSFILIDDLGGMGYRASCRNLENLDPVVTTAQDKLLIKFGATSVWKPMLIYWLLIFYSGILALIVSTLTYVLVEEPVPTRVVMAVVVGLTIIPSTWLILFRPHSNGTEGDDRPTQRY